MSQNTSGKTTSTIKLHLRTGVWIVSLGLSGLTACTTVQPPPPAAASGGEYYAKGVPGGVSVQTVTVSARVAAIDKAARNVTLLRADGKKFSVKVGPEAVNFDQVNVHDLVNVTITEQLVVYVADVNEQAGDNAAAVMALSDKGMPPGGLVAGTIQITGTITSIDTTQRTATLKFEDGSTETFPVRPDIDLSARKVGEKVVFRTTEMIAISVEKPKP